MVPTAPSFRGAHAPGLAAGTLLALGLLVASRSLAANTIPLTTPQGARILTRQWTVEDGLPDHHVEEIQQGPDGAMWVGTRGGLVRVLGDRVQPVPLGEPGVRHFRLVFDATGIGWLSTRTGMVWTAHPRHLNPLWTSRLAGLAPGHAVTRDGRGVIWLGTGSSVIGVEPGGNQQLPPGEPPPGLELTRWAMVGSRQAGVLVASTNGSIWRGDAGGWRPLAPPPPGLAGLGWCQLGEDRQGRLWFSWSSSLGPRGAAFFANGTWTPMPEGLLSEVGLPLFFALGADGEWLAGTANGWVMHLESNWGDSELQPIFPGEALNALGVDSQGNWWVGGTRFGVRKYSRSLATLHAQAPPVRVRSVAVLPGGKLVVGSQGAGVRMVGSLGLRLPENEDPLPTLPDTFVDSLLPTPHGLWLGTPDKLQLWQGGKPVDGASFGPPELTGSILALATNTAGVLFAGSTRGRVWQVDHGPPGYRLQTLGPTVGSAIAGLAVIRDTLWAATESGLRTWNGQTWETPRGGNAGGGARCIRLLREGWIAAGTDRGLWLQVGTNWMVWPAGPGRPLPPVNQLVEDAAGALWLGTARGLCQVRREDLARLAAGRGAEVPVSLRTKADGLPAQAFTHAAQPILIPGGRLAFPTQDGLLVLQPDFPRAPAAKPHVSITGVELDGRWHALDPSARTLPPRPRPGTARVRFEFVAVESPSQAGFRYRLGTSDQDWTVGASEREITLSQPGAGRHQFEVECHGADGRWEPAAQLTLEFQPYWWETTATKLGGLLLVVLAPLGAQSFAHRRRESRRQQEQAVAQALREERERIARELHDHIGNRLSAIQALSERLARETSQGEPNPLSGRLRQCSIEAVTMLEEAVRALGNSDGSSWPELVELLRQETAGYAEAIGARHQFSASEGGPINLPAQLQQLFLAGLRELLRNAHQHGRATHLRVQIESHLGRVGLQVEDNGQGFEVDQGFRARRGLAHLAARVRALGGGFQVHSQPGRTRVQLSFPWTR